MTHKLCEAMSTTASIGLNQADYIAISRTESSTSTAGASSTTITATTEAGSTNNSQPSPAHTSSNERPSAAALPIASQDSETLLSGVSDNRRKTVEEREQLANHKSESADRESESGQIGLTTPRGDHVTNSEATATKLKGVGVKEDGAAVGSSSSSKGNRTTFGGSEVQLPAKQALAVLSNVSKTLMFIVYFDDSLSCY